MRRLGLLVFHFGAAVAAAVVAATSYFFLGVAYLVGVAPNPLLRYH